MITSWGTLSWSFARTAVRATTVGFALVMCIGCLHWGPGISESVVDCDSAECFSGDCEAYCCLPMKRYSRCLDERFASNEAAKRAFVSMQGCYPERPNTDFQFGYRSAFVDVALGGDGVVPAIPPEKYWSTCYRTAAGHQRAEDWFAGYTAGAARATAHCRYQFNRVPSSGASAFVLEDENSSGIIRTDGSADTAWGSEVDASW